jgi:Type II secretion system (T2SS), protein F
MTVYISVLGAVICLLIGGWFLKTALHRRQSELWGVRLGQGTALASPMETGLFSEFDLKLPMLTNHFSGSFLKADTNQDDQPKKQTETDTARFWQRAGLSYRQGQAAFLFIKSLIWIGVMWCAYLFDLRSYFTEDQTHGWIINGCIVGGLAIFLPEVFIKYLARKYRVQMEQAAPDVIELLMLSVEAGLGFDIALIETEKRMAGYSKAISKELQILINELNILPEREQALTNFATRTGAASFEYLKTALVQGERYGSSVGQSLRIVAWESREIFLMKKEEKAHRLPVLLGVPLMFLILPPIVVVAGGPGFVQMMRSLT